MRSVLRSRAGAIAWRERASAPCSVVWVDGTLAQTEEGAEVLRQITGDSICDRIAAALHSGETVLKQRALSAAHDRIALEIALASLPLSPNGSTIPRPNLSHTPLGQPILCREDGARAAELHVSFSHDGDAHLCLLARSHILRGVGIDVVHLPRLRGRSDSYLHRFASHFMSEEEYAAFAAWADTGESLLNRVCAHFSIMEAASKALGTGLKIGAGMGKKESLPKQSLGVLYLEPQVDLLLDEKAQARLDELGAARMEGHWAADEEYGVSAVFAFA